MTERYLACFLAGQVTTALIIWYVVWRKFRD